MHPVNDLSKKAVGGPLSLPSIPHPLKWLGGLGERYSSPSGSGLSPAAKRILVQFTVQICKSVSFTHVHKTPMQHFITFSEYKFCPCCKHISCIFEAKFYINGVIKPATSLAHPSQKNPIGNPIKIYCRNAYAILEQVSYSTALLQYSASQQSRTFPRQIDSRSSCRPYKLFDVIWMLCWCCWSRTGWGLKPTPQTKIFSHQCGGHSQPV